jgi:hypothetical protein
MKKKLPEFGSVEWQNMMLKSALSQMKKTGKLEGFERAFMQVQIERLPEKEQKYWKKKLKKVL